MDIVGFMRYVIVILFGALCFSGCGGGMSSLTPGAGGPEAAGTGQTSAVTVVLRDDKGAVVNGMVTLAGITRSTEDGRVTFSRLPGGIQRGEVVVQGQTMPISVSVDAGGVVEVPITVKATATPTPVPTPRATPAPTPVPTPRPTATPTGPAPVIPPSGVFDLRGKVLVGGVPRAGLQVRVTGTTGAVTATDATVSGAGGFYSFFLGGGTYVVTATNGARSVTRRVTIPAGGQTVDNFNLTL